MKIPESRKLLLEVDFSLGIKFFGFGMSCKQKHKTSSSTVQKIDAPI